MIDHVEVLSFFKLDFHYNPNCVIDASLSVTQEVALLANAHFLLFRLHTSPSTPIHFFPHACPHLQLPFIRHPSIRLPHSK